MKLIPNYSYEFNVILNDAEDFNEQDQIQNFASLISDKDRFLSLVSLIEKNSKLIEEKLGYQLPTEINFYVVRAEKFKSFSLPITIEYSLLPEEMFLFLLKEVLKTSTQDRFLDDESKEQYTNSLIEHLLNNGDFGGDRFSNFVQNLHDESKRLFSAYESKEIDFKEKTLKKYIEEMYT